MAQFQPRRQQQILANMLARVVTRTDLADVSDSSSMKQMLAAAAREDDEIYFQMENLRLLFGIDTATGDDLDERAKEIQPSQITRISAVRAVGEVVFSRNTVSGTVSIPEGTQVKTADGIVFRTTEAGEINPTSPEQITGHGVGRDSLPVDIIAVVSGTEGNVVSGTIIKFETRPSGVDEVTNPNPTTLGRDQESDDAFRQRIKDYIASLARSTVLALESGVLGVEDPETTRQILFAKAVEDYLALGNVVLYIDDGTGSVESNASVTGENVTAGLSGPPPDSAVGGETELYLDNKPVKIASPFTLTSSTRGALTQGTHYTVNSASGQIIFSPALVTGEVITADYTYFTGLIAIAQRIVDGDSADRTNYPGIRAAGVLVVVKTPSVVIQTVTATLTVWEGYDFATVQAQAVNAIKTYINNLGISDDVIRAELIRQIQQLAGVRNVVLSVPSTDIAIADDQLVRTTDANITVN